MGLKTLLPSVSLLCSFWLPPSKWARHSDCPREEGNSSGKAYSTVSLDWCGCWLRFVLEPERVETERLWTRASNNRWRGP